MIIIVSWQWLPFASLILLTSLQSLDLEQKEAAELDGAGAIPYFFYIMLPHLARAITVVILIETIFLLSVFAEILVTTNGGPGDATTNITFLIYKQALLDFDVGVASAGGVVAVVLANIVAIFLIRIVGKNLEAEAMAMRQSMGRRIGVNVLAWAGRLLIFFPILWTILTSFKTELDAIAFPPKFLFFHGRWRTIGEVQARCDYLLFA